MFTPKQLSILSLVVCSIIPGLLYSQVPFTFTINSNARTSAGVFQKDGTLIKTLWSGVKYNTGTYGQTWDRTDDEGKAVQGSDYDIRVLSNNVTYEWEGTVGNNSKAITGSQVHRGLHEMYSMAISGNNAYYATYYNEANPAQVKFNLSNPRVRLPVFTIDDHGPTGQQTTCVAADGVNVYWAGVDPFDPTKSFVFATRVSDDIQSNFSSGTKIRTNWGMEYFSAINIVDKANSDITGLAVQKTGNYLFVSRKALNNVQVLHKTTGALVQTISFASPRELTVDGNDKLWMISATNTIAKYTVNPNGSLTAATVNIPGLIDPLAIAVSPDNSTIVVADAGASQQLKAFSNSSGGSLWTFGQPGGYLTDATVTNDKFYFSDLSGGVHHTFIAFQADGSFWVGDAGNYRTQHYSASRSFIDRIMYVKGFYSSGVDANDPTRVFAEYLEFKINYSLPLGPDNGSWELVKNWRAAIPKDYWQDYMLNILKSVTTLSNGRTYALCENLNPSIRGLAMVELPPTGPIRFTPVRVDYGFEVSCLYKDGSLRRPESHGIGNPAFVASEPLIGFDASHNPLYGNTVTLSNVTARATDPVDWDGSSHTTGSVTSSGILISFDPGQIQPDGRGDGFHLGGLKNNKWVWRTAKSTGKSHSGNFPQDGSFDTGNKVINAGGDVTVIDKNIFWNYKGEGWKGGQTNKWNHVYDNGLFVGQFGSTSFDEPGEAGPGMSGNVWGGYAVKDANGNVYLYHNDESGHGGVMRWKVNGLNTIQEQVIPLSSSSNRAPVANAGTAKTITLPDNSAVLNGSGTDSDGTITLYNWTQVSGPNTAVFNSSTASEPTLSGLIAGNYIFSLTVTDNQEALSVANEVSVTVNAIASTETKYRINAGGEQVITNSIGVFTADANYFPAPGNTYSVNTDIFKTYNNAIYQTERYGTNGTMSYAFPVSNGNYTVVLHFAELYYTASGSRIFDVTLEETKVLDNYDIFKKVGALTATTETFIINVTDGTLNVYFSSLAIDEGNDQPTIAAIEIFNSPASQTLQASAGVVGTATPSRHTEEQAIKLKHTIKATPNPSAHSFTLDTKSNSNSLLTIRIFDAVGTLIETKRNVTPNSMIKIGTNYGKGVYYAEVWQDKSRVAIKLIKQ